jgi:hypothetical protein
MVDWSADFRNVMQGLQAACVIFMYMAFLAWVTTYAKKNNNFKTLFMSRRQRVESQFLVYRGKHYPKKTIKIRTQGLWRRFGKHKWGR